MVSCLVGALGLIRSSAESIEFEDDASPGSLVNPFTGERMELDRHCPGRVAQDGHNQTCPLVNRLVKRVLGLLRFYQSVIDHDCMLVVWVVIYDELQNLFLDIIGKISANRNH